MALAITDIAASVVEAARSSDTMIITVESCTAGSLATLIADTPHAGEVLLGGFVTYAKTCKTELLGIPPGVLSACSAVSSEVAGAMVQGALDRCPSASLAVAVTCVGGPEPDDDGNPVGLTFIAVQRRGGKARVQHLKIEGTSSGRVRGQVLAEALSLMLEEMPRVGARQ